MIAVSLLGRVSVSVDGVPISGEAAQRRRLALIALLTIPNPRPVSRDRLMLYLWPESDVESARHLLSVAVHILRKALGHETLVTTADEVALAPGEVQVDVAAFEDAVRRGDPEAAVGLYGGPFMDGFHAGAGVELEQWIEGERTRLQRSYAQALEALAAKRRTVGDLTGAVDAWNRLAVLDPYSSHGALGLMRALADAGNRAAAIRHAAVHAQLLESELGAGPDAQVEALAEALRAEVMNGAAGARAAASGVSAVAGTTTVVAPDAQVAVAEPESGPAAPSVPPFTEVSRSASFESPATGDAGPGTPGSGVATRGATTAVTVELPPRGRIGWFRRTRGRVALAAVLLLGVVGVAAVLWWKRSPPAERLPQAVAVVPLTGAGSSADDYLAEGIAEQILDELQHVEGLNVISSTSSFAFRDGRANARVIGDSLHVQSVLFVHVQRAGARIRVMVEVANTRNNLRVGGHRYDRPDGDRFAIQDDIARDVAKDLDSRIRPGASTGPGTSDVQALDLYQRGRQAWAVRTPASLAQAIRNFKAAVAKDTSYALAWAGLAEALIVAGSYDYGVLRPDSAYPLARRAAQRAIELRPQLAQGHAALASVYMDYDWNLSLAEREFLEAIRRNPGYSPAHQWYGLLLTAQRRDKEAFRQMQIAGETDPASPALFVTRAQYYYYTRQYSHALEELQRALQLDPSFATAGLLMALTEIQMGQAAQAARQMEAVRARSAEPVVASVLGYARARSGDRAGALECRNWLRRQARGRFVPSELLALVETGLGDRQAALASLETAYRNQSDGMIYLAVEPAMDPLRAEARFEALLRSVQEGRHIGSLVDSLRTTRVGS